MNIDLNSLPVDLTERKPMKLYHVNQRDEIRRAYLQKGHFQPKGHEFPIRDFGAKPPRFQQAWFVDNKYWLEYSVKEDAAFCLCCYLFKSSIPNQGGSDHFVKSGFKAWNRKLGIDNHKALCSTIATVANHQPVTTPADSEVVGKLPMLLSFAVITTGEEAKTVEGYCWSDYARCGPLMLAEEE
ncbi:hypothetical protein LXL04_002326 [Taraxacum kok-saghyz]